MPPAARGGPQAAGRGLGHPHHAVRLACVPYAHAGMPGQASSHLLPPAPATGSLTCPPCRPAAGPSRRACEAAVCQQPAVPEVGAAAAAEAVPQQGASLAPFLSLRRSQMCTPASRCALPVQPCLALLASLQRVACGPRVLSPDPAYRRWPGELTLSNAACRVSMRQRCASSALCSPRRCEPAPRWTLTAARQAYPSPPLTHLRLLPWLQKVKGECFELVQLAFQAHMTQVLSGLFGCWGACLLACLPVCLLACLLACPSPLPSPAAPVPLSQATTALHALPHPLQLIQRSLRSAGHRQDACRRSAECVITSDPRRGVTQVGLPLPRAEPRWAAASIVHGRGNPALGC